MSDIGGDFSMKLYNSFKILERRLDGVGEDLVVLV